MTGRSIPVEAGAALDVVYQAACPGCGTLGTITADSIGDGVDLPALGSVGFTTPFPLCPCDPPPDTEFRVVRYSSGWADPAAAADGDDEDDDGWSVENGAGFDGVGQ